jgi:hypothetical protein
VIQRRNEIIHDGKYAAEVPVELIEEEGGSKKKAAGRLTSLLRMHKDWKRYGLPCVAATLPKPRNLLACSSSHRWRRSVQDCPGHRFAPKAVTAATKSSPPTPRRMSRWTQSRFVVLLFMAMNIEAEVRDLKRRVSELEGSFWFLTQKIKAVRKDLLAFQAKTEQRFANNDGRLDRLERGFGACARICLGSWLAPCVRSSVRPAAGRARSHERFAFPLQ